MTPELRKAVRKIWRDNRHAPRAAGNTIWIDHMINRRAGLLAVWDAVEENDKIGICRSGMDCDCVQYLDEDVIERPRSVFRWLQQEEEHHKWLDGPEQTTFCSPSEIPEGGYHNSVDRALEAYENGHPHHVTWGDI